MQRNPSAAFSDLRVGNLSIDSRTAKCVNRQRRFLEEPTPRPEPRAEFRLLPDTYHVLTT